MNPILGIAGLYSLLLVFYLLMASPFIDCWIRQVDCFNFKLIAFGFLLIAIGQVIG